MPAKFLCGIVIALSLGSRTAFAVPMDIRATPADAQAAMETLGSQGFRNGSPASGANQLHSPVSSPVSDIAFRDPAKLDFFILAETSLHPFDLLTSPQQLLSPLPTHVIRGEPETIALPRTLALLSAALALVGFFAGRRGS